VKTLTMVLKAEKTPDTSASGASDVSTELKDPTKRQMHMTKLLEEGQAKVFTASNITKGVGDVAQFILSTKGLVDLAIQNIPQAALPWAGVCVGLQVSTHLSISKAVSVSTDVHPDPLESCESDKIQPRGHHTCGFQNGLVLQPDRTSPEQRQHRGRERVF
jgi:N-terminal domain of NWD NACHT-NTPase